MTDRNRLARLFAFAVIAGLLLLLVVVVVHKIRDQDTVLITLPSFGACLLAFVAGGVGPAIVYWGLRTPFDPWSKSGVVVTFGYCLLFGWLGIQALCWRVEASAFGSGKPVAQARAEFIVIGKHMSWKSYDRDKAWIKVVADEDAFGVDVPVSRALYDQVLRIRGDRFLDQDCLTLYIQRSDDMIRAVLRAPDGRTLPQIYYQCGAAPVSREEWLPSTRPF